MDRTRLKELLVAHREGSIGTADSELLNAYVYAASEQEILLLRSVLAELMEEGEEDFTIPVLSEELYSNILADARFGRKRSRLSLYRWAASVAAVVLVIGGGIWMWGEGEGEISSERNAERIRTITH